MKKILLALSSAALLVVATVAHATTLVGTSEMFTLNQDGCTGGCGTNDATVTIKQTSAGVVTVSESLLNGTLFSQSSGKDALDFNLSGVLGTLSVVLSDTTDYTWEGVGSYSAPPFGNFLEQVVCSTCQGGKTTNPPQNASQDLSFTITSNGAGGVDLSDFVGNGSTTMPSTNYYFSSDVRGGVTGNTGDIASLGGTIIPPPPTPEPSSLLLLGTGIVGAAGLIRRRMAQAVNR